MLNVNGLTTGSSPNASHTKKHRERKTESHAAESHSEQPLLDGGVIAILNPISTLPYKQSGSARFTRQCSAIVF